MAVKLRCPSCRDAFRWDGPFPKHCPLCGAFVGVDGKPEVAVPHVSHGRAKALSQSSEATYRAMEQSSEDNAKQAADMLGVSVAEMGDMKITNAETQLREGDSAIKASVNDVSRMIAAPQAQNILGNPGAATGQFFAESTPKTGVEGRKGSKALMSMGNWHRKNSGGIVAAGEAMMARKNKEVAGRR